MTIKVVTTHDLLLMAKAGIDNKLNRQLNSPVVKAVIDDTKVCILSLLLYGHNMDMQGVPLHHRVQALIPIKNQTEPMEVVLDVLDEHFKQLTDAKKLTAWDGSDYKVDEINLGVNTTTK